MSCNTKNEKESVENLEVSNIRIPVAGGNRCRSTGERDEPHGNAGKDGRDLPEC